MSVVGELSVIITADADGVKKAISASNAALKKGSVQLRKSVNDWGKWAAAATIAATAVASAIVKSQLSSIKEIKNLSDAANTSVEEFQRGAYAADQVGISMEKYGDILKDTTERIGEFASIGSGPMIDFFETVAPKVGVTADMFKKLSGQEALQLYVKSLEAANLSQQDMTFYMETIASDSVRLLPLLKNNSKAMKEQAERARELGVGLDQIDVAQALAAEKALKDSAVAMDAALKTATVAVAPFITEIMKSFEGTIGSVDEFAEAISEGFGFAGKVVGVFANGIRGISVAFKGVEVIARGVVATIAFAFEGLFTITTAIGNKILDGWRLIFKGMADLIRPMNETAAELFEDMAEGVESMKVSVPQFIQDMSTAQIEALKNSKEELHNLAMQELPSESVERWVSKIKEGVELAKEEIRKVIAEDLISPDGGEGNTVAESEEAKRIREENEQMLEALTERYLMEETTMQEHFDRQLAIVNAAEDNKTISTERAAGLRKQIAEDERRAQIGTVTDTMGAIVTALSAGGKKSQAIAKKVAIAKAIISGGQAAVDAWKAGMSTGGPWAPAVAAAYTAASLARTAGQISSIRSNSLPSKGGGSMPSVSTPSASPVSSQPQQQSNRSISINMVGGSMFNAEAVRELIGQINDQVGDGVNLVTTG